MRGVAGVTPMETRVAALTVKVVVPNTLPKAAVMVVAPAATAVASPLLPPASLMVATFAAPEVQVTNAEISFLEPSL